MKTFLIALFTLCVYNLCVAQNVVQAEYFIDTDNGVGKNTLVTLTPEEDGTFPFTVNLSGVSLGYHKLYIRTKDSDGKWSITARRSIEVISAQLNKFIVASEYFIDIDPGFGKGNAIAVSPQDSAITQNFTAVVAGLQVGYHKLYARFRDNHGNWSQVTRRNIEVIDNSPYVLIGGEYFFNTDPGFGKAQVFTFPVPSADGTFIFNIPPDKIPTGAHTLYLRVKDSSNKNWSHTGMVKDTVITSVKTGNWSDPATWSSNKVPDSNTVVVIHHDVTVDIDGHCRSLTPYKNAAKITVLLNKLLRIYGRKKD